MGLFDLIRGLLGGEPRPNERPESPGPDPKVPAKTFIPAQPKPVSPPSAPVASRKPAQPKDAKNSLDASQFTPLSGAAARDAARGLGSVWANPWFGRRDAIPPASDPRTKVIDRGMVGAGLISSEDLVEIHRVGDEMERLKPELTRARQDAADAVRLSDEERLARKEQKKKEAAERKRLHREAVEKRKASDIIFLGRGVSKGLADRRANVEKLQAAGLPILAEPTDIATALNLPIKRLRWLAFHSEASIVTHYIRFTVPKKSGGTRELAAPHKQMSAAQHWILENILAKIPVSPSAHGFVPQRSTLTNAQPHVKKAAVVNVDMRDFFPSISFDRVRGIFQQLGYSPAAATILALICTECPRRKVLYAGKPFHVATGPRGLPQGACTSPALSNLAARGLDSRFSRLGQKLGWAYTRYADDLTFSATGETAQKPGYLLARIRHIAQDESFQVNEKKTRIQRSSSQQTVTGIVVNQYPNVSRKLARRLRAILHRAKTEGLAAQNRQNLPHFESWLQGTIAYVKMVNPQQGSALQKMLATVKPQKS